MVDERRTIRRWHAVLKGEIVPGSGSAPIECTVRDLSNTGAKILLHDICELPPEFELEIPSRGLRVRSRLKWSRRTEHGVMFSEEVEAWTDPVRTAVL